MKWIAIVVGTLVGLVALVCIVGALRPADHTASITVSLGRPRAEVWAVVADAEHMPDWFHECKSVQRIPDIDGKPTYREDYGSWTATIVIRESVDGQRLVREIQPGQAFSGSWTFELADDGPATRLTITERGHVSNAFFRGMMVLMDPTKTMRQYAIALAAKLGTPAAFIQHS